MIPNDQPLRKQTIERMIDKLMDNLYSDNFESCTEWEHEFIISINDQFKNKSDLSNRQCEILEKIYDKIE